jgi:hypothetical protein
MDDLWTAVAELMNSWNAIPDQPRAVRHALTELRADAINNEAPSLERTKRIILCNIAIREHDQLFPEAIV